MWEGVTPQQVTRLRAPEPHGPSTLQGETDASVLVATTVLGRGQEWTVERTEGGEGSCFRITNLGHPQPLWAPHPDFIKSTYRWGMCGWEQRWLSPHNTQHGLEVLVDVGSLSAMDLSAPEDLLSRVATWQCRASVQPSLKGLSISFPQCSYPGKSHQSFGEDGEESQ